jgi:hypothetical protein
MWDKAEVQSWPQLCLVPRLRNMKLYFCCPICHHSSSSEAWNLVVDLCFRYSLSPVPMVSDHCLPACYSQFIYLFFWTSSLHLLCGLRHFLTFSIVAIAICFGICWFCFRSTWPYHLRHSDFRNFTVSFPCNMFFISLFVLVLQCSLSFRGLYILLTIFCSNILCHHYLVLNEVYRHPCFF